MWGTYQNTIFLFPTERMGWGELQREPTKNGQPLNWALGLLLYTREREFLLLLTKFVKAGRSRIFPWRTSYAVLARHRGSGRVQDTLLYSYLGFCGTGVRNLRKFQVRVWMSYTKLTEVPGARIKVLQSFQMFPVSRHGPREHTEAPGTGMKVLQNVRMFRARVMPANCTPSMGK